MQVAGNGLEALQAIDSGAFDLVLLGLWMPQVNGFGAARRFRLSPDPNVTAIPIVALTADVTEGTAAESRRSGINETVGKPLSPEKFASLLRTYRA